jgi:nitroimidazol reductase NimA-like FMN-containing flavoprotein (pyridoxamine 5'-phosphate oxidase superfamily)
VTLTMTTAEREEFLAGLHVAVLGVDEPGRGPLIIPVWYSYAPGETVNVVTGGQSVKAQLLRAAGRFSLCV